MAIENIWENRGLFRNFTEKITATEILSFNLTIQGDARFDTLRYVINDFTHLSDFVGSENDIEAIAAIDDAASMSNPYIKVAIISTSESFLAWANFYCTKMENTSYDCKIFANKNDAYDWVNIS